jgi:hypothetical protein
MDGNSFYLYQYKALREEIMFSMGQLYSTEMYGALAVLVVYAWLFLNSSRISIRALWFIPPFLIIVCAVHCLVLSLRISMMGSYLKEIEEVMGTDSRIVGWEHYKLSHGWLDASDHVLATVACVIAFVASIAISQWGARMRLRDVVRQPAITDVV